MRLKFNTLPVGVRAGMRIDSEAARAPAELRVDS